MEKEHENVPPDPQTQALFRTGRDMLTEEREVVPMLIGSRNGEDTIALLFRWDPEEAGQGIERYIVAIGLCLFSGVDYIYELRDVYMSHISKDEVGEVDSLEDIPDDIPPPSQDPNAIEALAVTKSCIETVEQTFFVQKYRRGDRGELTFEDIDGTHDMLTKGGRLGPIMERSIVGWKEAGKPTGTLEEVAEMVKVLGFTGKVKVDDN